MKIYGISGLGADQRVFDYLKLNVEFIPVSWIAPKTNESIEDYAFRLSQVIDTSSAFGILGVSFGGLVAVEMSKILNPKFTILISSAETKSELRFLYRLVGKTQLMKVFSKELFNPPKSIAHFIFGTPQKELLNAILDDTDLNFAKWAVNELVNWKNEQKLSNVLKISGSKDKLIPPSKDDNTRLIQGGEHFMIVDRADEISEIINRWIG